MNILYKIAQFFNTVRERNKYFSKEELISKSHEFRNELIKKKSGDKHKKLIDEVRREVNEMISNGLIQKPHQIAKAYSDFFFMLANMKKKS